MNSVARPPDNSPFDPDLWVRDHHGHLGYLGANGFTFVGRFLTWWPHHDTALSTSLHELSECSPEAALWLRGYLRGSAPEAWFDDPEFDYSEDDPRTALWQHAVDVYQQTGTWAVGRECDVCGTELLPSSPVGLLCARHGGDLRSCWPNVAPSPSS